MPNLSPAQAIQLAIEHHRAGRLAEAEAIYRQVLAAEPRNVDALHFLGLLAQQVGRQDAAIALLRQAAALNPRGAEIYAALGASLGVSGDLDAAAEALRQAVQLKPDLADAHLHLGNVHEARGRSKQAIACYTEALKFEPKSFMARHNRGRVLLTLGRAPQAVDDFQAAVQLRPADAQSQFQLGFALEQSGRREEAIGPYRRAVELNPAFAEAHYNLGACLSAGGDAAEVVRHIAEAARLRPDFAEAHEKLLHFHHYMSEFDARQSLQRHREWARRFAEPLAKNLQPHANVRDPDRRLRIGYVSPDFRRHSVSYFLEPLLAAHDKREVEIFCYADEIKRDATTERLNGYADCWRTITGKSDTEVTQMIRADGIDILVELTGHVDHNRLHVFAQKPAPVQVSYLGYPDTTGLRAIDFRLTDALADPPGDSDACYTEKLVRLPDCAWCYRPDDASPPTEREGNDDAITFGCFNVATKINGPLIATWAAILRATPGSRLLIKDSQGTPSPALPRLRREFSRHGIGPDRLELLSFVPDLAAHLGLYRRIDIALDTFPYNGTTTTCEAMWMGVPVITLVGKYHLSCVGRSLLTAVGLADLIAQSPQEYIAIAARLAGDNERRRQLRRDLRAQMRRSPLMDSLRFARNVETAYREMWKRYARG